MKKQNKVKIDNSKLSICKCKQPKIETCLLSGIEFCMICISPIK